MSTTSSDSYIDPLRLKAVFKNLNDSTTYYTFDSFESSNPINIVNAQISLGLGQAGTFKMTVEDSAKVIDPTSFGLANKVYLYAGKSQNTYKPLMVGIGKVLEFDRRDTGLMEYTLSGSGISIVFNETVVNFKKSAFRQSLGSTQASQLDISHRADNLTKFLCTSTNVFPIINVDSIANRYNLGTDNISDKVTDFISNINEENVEASHAMNLIANSTGSYWGVDANGQIFLKYAQFEYSPIVIKDTVEPTDLADRTSYFIGSWKRRMSIRREDGFTNRVYSRTSSETIENFIESNSDGSTKLYNLAVAQQFIPATSRFINMGFLLRKVGNPVSQFGTLQGAVVPDNGGYPTGARILSFHIPLSDIRPQITAVYKMNILATGLNVVAGQKYWIILYSVGSNLINTIEWFHNNLQNETDSKGMNSAISDPDGAPLAQDLRWNVSNRGPVYAFATFDSLSHLSYAEDPLSVDKYGPVETFLDVRGLDDSRSLDRYLHTYLSFSAKPPLFYTINRVTIPDSLFIPGQLITIIDSLSGMPRSKNITAEIQEVIYNFDVDQFALGATTCEIRPLGYYDFLTELEGTCE